jgi:hypothetical protein
MGAFHGLNPAMGWLFAVALGFQERRMAAVVRALPPLALGHAIAIALVVAVVGGAGMYVSPAVLRYGSGAVLLGFAATLVIRRRTHPRWVGMRLGFRDLVLWSFLVSSAHGAGLMLVPVLLTSDHAGHAGGIASAGFAAVAVHTASMFVVLGVIAVLMFRMLGLEVLRRAWINLDWIWTGALVVAGAVTIAFA